MSISQATPTPQHTQEAEGELTALAAERQEQVPVLERRVQDLMARLDSAAADSSAAAASADSAGDAAAAAAAAAAAGGVEEAKKDGAVSTQKGQGEGGGAAPGPSGPAAPAEEK